MTRIIIYLLLRIWYREYLGVTKQDNIIILSIFFSLAALLVSILYISLHICSLFLLVYSIFEKLYNQLPH